MNLHIFNHHALTPDMGGGTRHYDFAKELIRRGHHVTIVASSFHYATFKEMKTYGKSPYLHETVDGVDFIWIHTRPYRGNGVGRVLNQLDYMRKALHVTPLSTPDIIIGSSVHLLAVFAAWRVACRLNVPFVMEVRDIWPQTLIDMGMSRWHPYVIAMGWLERFLYRRAVRIISLLPFALEHFASFGVKEKVVLIPNGVSLERNLRVPAYLYEPSDALHVLYAGAIGKANQIDVLCDVALLYQDDPSLYFHIVGDGSEKKTLEARGQKNVIFYGALRKEDAVARINGADILFFPLADSPVFKFGISSNKLFDYLAARKPVIFASNAKNNPVEAASCGISVPANDPQAVKNAIETLRAASEDERLRMGEHALAYATKHHDISVLGDTLEHLLGSLLYNDQPNSTQRHTLDPSSQQ